MTDLVTLKIYLSADADVQQAFSAWMEVTDRPEPPPLVTVVRVLGLARPDLLIEIEGVAVA